MVADLLVVSEVSPEAVPVPNVRRPDTFDADAPCVVETVGNPESSTPLFSEVGRRNTGFWTSKEEEMVVGPDPPS